MPVRRRDWFQGVDFVLQCISMDRGVALPTLPIAGSGVLAFVAQAA
jgi:hypothetical protein